MKSKIETKNFFNYVDKNKTDDVLEKNKNKNINKNKKNDVLEKNKNFFEYINENKIKDDIPELEINTNKNFFEYVEKSKNDDVLEPELQINSNEIFNEYLEKDKEILINESIDIVETELLFLENEKTEKTKIDEDLEINKLFQELKSNLEKPTEKSDSKTIYRELENKIKVLEENIKKLASQLEKYNFFGGGGGSTAIKSDGSVSKTDKFITKTQLSILSTETRNHVIGPLDTFRVAELRVSCYNQSQEYYYSFIIKGIRVLNTNVVNDIVYSKVGTMNITADITAVDNQVVLQIQNNESFDIFVDVISEI